MGPENDATFTEYTLGRKPLEEVEGTLQNELVQKIKIAWAGE